MSLERLQKIDDVLIALRFVHEDLAGELAASPQFKERFETPAPALMLSATFVADRNGLSRRAGGVQILGGDQRLWQLINLQPADLTGNETAINARLAERLRVHAGDDVSLFIEIPSAIPRESLLGKREGDFREIPLKIKAVIPDDAGAARLTLNPTQQLPLNAFVPLATLQQSVELARVERSRRNPEGSPAQINSALVSAKAPADQTRHAPDAARTLSDELARLLVPADLGLRLARHGPRLRFRRIAAADSRHRRRHGRHGECEEVGSQRFARARLSGQRTDERQGSEKVLDEFRSSPASTRWRRRARRLAPLCGRRPRRLIRWPPTRSCSTTGSPRI